MPASYSFCNVSKRRHLILMFDSNNAHVQRWTVRPAVVFETPLNSTLKMDKCCRARSDVCGDVLLAGEDMCCLIL